MPRVWQQSYADTIAVALQYRNAGQYWDAAIEFVWAAEVAPSRLAETAVLETAFLCLVLDARDDWGAGV